MATFTISDNCASIFPTGEVSLTIYAFKKDTFGGGDPTQYFIPSALLLAQAVTSVAADASGNFTLTVPTRAAYHLCVNSVLNASTWYWSWDHFPDYESNPTYAGTPTAVAGVNNGTSPPAPVVAAAANDQRGALTFGSGGSPAIGAQVVVTFKRALLAAPTVIVMPSNIATAAITPYVSAVTTTTFTVSTVLATTAAQANTIYAINWHTMP